MRSSASLKGLRSHRLFLSRRESSRPCVQPPALFPKSQPRSPASMRSWKAGCPRAEPVRKNALSMGFDLAGLEKAGKVAIVEARLPGGEIQSGDFDINGLLAIVDGRSEESRV